MPKQRRLAHFHRPVNVNAVRNAPFAGSAAFAPRHDAFYAVGFLNGYRPHLERANSPSAVACPFVCAVL
jgi:hypothetical protein